MDEQVRDELKRIVKDFGASVVDDVLRCEAILRDNCSSHRREVNVLIGALKEGIPSDLRNIANTQLDTLEANRLAAKLTDNLALSQNAANWAVESWAVALGLRMSNVPFIIEPSEKDISGATNPSDDVWIGITNILYDIMGIPPSQIRPAARLREDLEMDSLDLVEAVMALEDAFDIETSDEESMHLFTCGDVARYIGNRLAQKK